MIRSSSKETSTIVRSVTVDRSSFMGSLPHYLSSNLHRSATPHSIYRSEYSDDSQPSRSNDARISTNSGILIRSVRQLGSLPFGLPHGPKRESVLFLLD